MNVAAMDTKKAMRKQVKSALKKLDKETLSKESASISARLLASSRFKSFKQFGIYVHAERLLEVDTTAILQHVLQGSGDARCCYVPLVMDNNANMKLLHVETMDDLQAVPPFGIREPKQSYKNGTPRRDALTDPEGLDVLVMPGLAFDRSGGRLGRGGGYYDSFIAKCRARASELGRPAPLLVALAFQAQMVDNIPMMDHDEKVDVLVTSREVLRLTTRANDF